MFPQLPRKPGSYFGSAVDAVEILMPGVKRYLNILEGEISPEYDGPQMFSSLHPLSAALLLGALTPQDERSVSDVCSQAQPSFLNLLRHSQRWKLCGIVGSSSPFLAAVQIIIETKHAKPGPTCSVCSSPPPGGAEGFVEGDREQLGSCAHSSGSRGIPAPTGASSPGLVRWRSGAAAGWGVGASAPWEHVETRLAVCIQECPWLGTGPRQGET